MKINSLQVIKRDGRIEKFNTKKLYAVAKATGLNHRQAANLVKNIVNWANKKGVNRISSLTIRKVFYRELLKVNEYSASLYAWYQKLKDKTYSATYSTLNALEKPTRKKVI